MQTDPTAIRAKIRRKIEALTTMINRDLQVGMGRGKLESLEMELVASDMGSSYHLYLRVDGNRVRFDLVEKSVGTTTVSGFNPDRIPSGVLAEFNKELTAFFTTASLWFPTINLLELERLDFEA